MCVHLNVLKVIFFLQLIIITTVNNLFINSCYVKFIQNNKSVKTHEPF